MKKAEFSTTLTSKAFTTKVIGTCMSLMHAKIRRCDNFMPDLGRHDDVRFDGKESTEHTEHVFHFLQKSILIILTERSS